MKRIILTILFLVFCLVQLIAQNSNPDSLKADKLKVTSKDTIQTDSVTFDKNITEEQLIRDTLNQIFGIDDTIEKDTIETPDTTVIPKSDYDKFYGDTLIMIKPSYHSLLIDLKMDSFVIDSLLMKDTVRIADTLPIKDSVIIVEETYDEFMDRLEDSLIFETPDSTYYVIKNIRELLKTDTLNLNDTTLQAINKLIQYKYGYYKIDSVKNYLRSKFEQNQFLFESEDTSIQALNDSVKHAVRYILNSFPEDSLNLVFKNALEDSIFFNAPEDQIDSVHFKIFDNRGEFAVLWIKKTDKNVFDLILEEGTYIEKAKQQKIVTQQLDTDGTKSGLRKVRKVNIIVPIWEFGSSADIRFNQGYHVNWVEGGENNLSALSVFKFNADYSYGKKRSWDNDIEFRLGYLKAGDNPLQKNDDRFELNSKYGRTAFNNWYYSFLFNFKTQFLKGYDYPNDSVPVSKFLSPGHLIFSFGLDYKPNKNLTVLISPVTSKFTLFSDTTNYDQTRFGVGENEKIRKEIGAYIKAIWKYNITEDIFMENKINFFTNYINNPQNVDIEWELNLEMKLTRYINMSIMTHLIYDDDVDIPVFEDGEQVGVTKNVQFREVVGIGFSYNF